MAYSQFSLDAFRANLINGGARDNLYLVTGSFPNGGSRSINAAAGIAGAIFGTAAAGAVSAVGGLVNNGNANGQITFLTKGAKIPAAKMSEGTANFMGRTLKFPADRTFDNWTINVYNDGSYNLRKAFESWSNLINTYASNVGPNNFNSFLMDWSVQPLTREGNAICTYKFIGCYPATVGEVNLSFEAKNSISEFQVDLSYQYYELVGTTT
jgi:hypothetical protein